MPAEEDEMCEVVVVLDEFQPDQIDGLVATLKSAGMEVDEVDASNGVVEGAILSSKFKSLEKTPGVKFVRNVFSYRAEPPPSSEVGKDALDEETDDAR